MMDTRLHDTDQCSNEPIELPVTDALDLHAFSPREVKNLVPHYLALCRGKGILRVRIIHGKGSGAMRATVTAILSRLPWVEEYDTAPPSLGHWGATIVSLRPPEASF